MPGNNTDAGLVSNTFGKMYTKSLIVVGSRFFSILTVCSISRVPAPPKLGLAAKEGCELLAALIRAIRKTMGQFSTFLILGYASRRRAQAPATTGEERLVPESDM